MGSTVQSNGVRLGDLEDGTLPPGTTFLQPIHIVPAAVSTGKAGSTGGGSASGVSVTGVSVSGAGLTQSSLGALLYALVQWTLL